MYLTSIEQAERSDDAYPEAGLGRERDSRVDDDIHDLSIPGTWKKLVDGKSTAPPTPTSGSNSLPSQRMPLHCDAQRNHVDRAERVLTLVHEPQEELRNARTPHSLKSCPIES